MPERRSAILRPDHPAWRRWMHWQITHTPKRFQALKPYWRLYEQSYGRYHSRMRML